MKKYIIIITLLALGLISYFSVGEKTPKKFSFSTNNTVVHFSPHGGCREAILIQINKSSKQILVQAYNFTDLQIVAALIEAKQRGVDVKIICDESASKSKYQQEAIVKCRNAGIVVSLDGKHKIAHNKIIIIDGVIVITGSYNFSNSAENYNAENLLVISDVVLANSYIDNWNKHYSHSTMSE